MREGMPRGDHAVTGWTGRAALGRFGSFRSGPDRAAAKPFPLSARDSQCATGERGGRAGTAAGGWTGGQVGE